MNGVAVIANDIIERIADAIRGKDGTSNTMKVGEMAERIEKIPQGVTDGLYKQVVERTVTKVVDNDVESIGARSFANCEALTMVSFAAATSVGSYAFEGCTALNTASFPAASYVDIYAFSGCTALTDITLPVVESVGMYAFSGCTSLAAISLPSATLIGSNALYRCNALTTASFPAATTIIKSAFYGCPALKEISLLKFTKEEVTNKYSAWKIPTGQNITVHCSDGDIEIA